MVVPKRNLHNAAIRKEFATDTFIENASFRPQINSFTFGAYDAESLDRSNGDTESSSSSKIPSAEVCTGKVFICNIFNFLLSWL